MWCTILCRTSPIDNCQYRVHPDGYSYIHYRYSSTGTRLQLTLMVVEVIRNVCCL